MSVRNRLPGQDGGLMTERIQAADTAALRKAFQSGKGTEGPFIYFPLDSEREDDRTERITKLFAGYKRHQGLME